MRELHVVGLTPDGKHLLLTGSGEAVKPSHRIAVDARFEAALRGVRIDAPSLVPDLSPREIQARLRAGATVEQVAAEAGLPVSRVQRFAGPVQSERYNLLGKVFAAYQSGRRGTSSETLERAVTGALAELAFTKPETLIWTALRRAEGGWVARVSITIRGRAKSAEWSLAPDGKTVRPLDAWASSLGHVEAAAQPARVQPAHKTPTKPAAPAPTRPAAKPTALMPGRLPPPGLRSRRLLVPLPPAGGCAGAADHPGRVWRRPAHRVAVGGPFGLRAIWLHKGKAGWTATLAVALLAGCSSVASTGASSRSPVSINVPDSPAQLARTLLARRSQAVVHRDAAAFAGTVSPTASPAERASQLAGFRATGGLTFGSWQLTVSPAASTTPPAVGRWILPVTLRYTLAGWDTAPVELARTLSFARAPAGGWAIAADTRRDAPWDFGPVLAVRDGPALVLAHPDALATAKRLAGLAAHGVPVVTKAWGTDWSQRVVIVLPATTAELQAELGTSDNLSGLAAVQTVELPGGSAAAGTGDRILINPPVFLQRTSPLGQAVVLTHEITHVASRASTTPNVPLWLVEGLADTVAFGRTQLTPREGAPELAALIRTHVVPAAFPVDAAFAPGAQMLDSTYEQAWLACRLIKERVGQPGLVALYRFVGSGASVAAALQRVLHTTPAQLVADWQISLRNDLA